MLAVIRLESLDGSRALRKRYQETLDYALQEEEYREFRNGRSFMDFLMKREGTSLAKEQEADAEKNEEQAEGCRGELKVLFAAELPMSGWNMQVLELNGFLHAHPHLMDGWSGAVFICGESELFTKRTGRDIIFAANDAGCAFPGKPLCEGTGSLYNWRTMAHRMEVDIPEAFRRGARFLVQKLKDFRLPEVEAPEVLMIHASSRKTSNTLLLWEMIKEEMTRKNPAVRTHAISLRNGAVVDCRGCSYEACRHFGEKADCFYGGVMVEQVYPALLKCNSIMLVCPNYNDSVSANIAAFFNRLTALYSAYDFSEKKVYALVVSGYSGGDIVAEQVMGAMNCNKNFILPPHFCMLETANDPKSILECPGIRERAAQMAENIACAPEN